MGAATPGERAPGRWAPDRRPDGGSGRSAEIALKSDEAFRDEAALRSAVAAGWAPVEVAHLGGWRLGASAGFTRRANSVAVLGDSGTTLDEAIGHVRGWYDERALPALIRAVPDSELDRELAARGWSREAAAYLMTAPLGRVNDLLRGHGNPHEHVDTSADLKPDGRDGFPAPDPAAGPGPTQRPVSPKPAALSVSLARTPDADWLARYHKADGDKAAALAVLGSGASTWFATAVPTEPPGGGGSDGAGSDSADRPNAIGRCVIDGRFVGFAAIEVAPALRRRGAAKQVMTALVGQALAEGAETAWLQVENDNAAALALYTSLGFTVHDAHHYRRAPRFPRG